MDDTLMRDIKSIRALQQDLTPGQLYDMVAEEIDDIYSLSFGEGRGEAPHCGLDPQSAAEIEL